MSPLRGNSRCFPAIAAFQLRRQAINHVSAGLSNSNVSSQAVEEWPVRGVDDRHEVPLESARGKPPTRPSNLLDHSLRGRCQASKALWSVAFGY